MMIIKLCCCYWYINIHYLSRSSCQSYSAIPSPVSQTTRLGLEEPLCCRSPCRWLDGHFSAKRCWWKMWSMLKHVMLNMDELLMNLYCDHTLAAKLSKKKELLTVVTQAREFLNSFFFISFTYSFTIFTRYHVSAPQSVIISWIMEPEGSGSAGLGAARPRSPGPRGRQDSFRSSSGDLAVQGGLVIHPEVVNAKVMLKRNAIDKMEYSRCTSTCSNLFVDFPPKSHYLKCIIRTFERTTENSKLGSRHLKAAMNWHMCYG